VRFAGETPVKAWHLHVPFVMGEHGSLALKRA
jgi:hypothetical protein